MHTHAHIVQSGFRSWDWRHRQHCLGSAWQMRLRQPMANRDDTTEPRWGSGGRQAGRRWVAAGKMSLWLLTCSHVAWVDWPVVWGLWAITTWRQCTLDSAHHGIHVEQRRDHRATRLHFLALRHVSLLQWAVAVCQLSWTIGSKAISHVPRTTYHGAQAPGHGRQARGHAS